MENQKMIGGVSIERWRRAFAYAAAIAMDKDYFSDTLFYDLYPNIDKETNNIDEEDEEAICDIYNEKWDFVDEAFKEIFGVDRHLV